MGFKEALMNVAEQNLLNKATTAALRQSAMDNRLRQRAVNAQNAAKAGAMDAMAQKAAMQQGVIGQGMRPSGRVMPQQMKQAPRAKMPMPQQARPSRRF